MKQWHYNVADTPHGPVDETELKRLLSTGSVPPSTLVWSDGMSGWKSAALIPELADSPYSPPASRDESGIDWSGYEPSGSQVRPWVRYWARTMDLILLGIVAGLVLAFTAPAVLEWPDTLFGVILMGANVFLEPLGLSVFGTTPMKALFKVRLRNADGSRLSYLQALRRTLDVSARGLGLGIPLASFITCVMANTRLNNQHITVWDEAGGFVVSHQKIAWWRWLVFTGLLAGFLYLLILGAET